MFENSENENCNKTLQQKNAGTSYHKSYNKYKTHSLDECAKKIINGLRAIPKHMNNGLKKNV